MRQLAAAEYRCENPCEAAKAVGLGAKLSVSGLWILNSSASNALTAPSLCLVSLCRLLGTVLVSIGPSVAGVSHLIQEL